MRKDKRKQKRIDTKCRQCYQHKDNCPSEEYEKQKRKT
jgi:hypothetical protein